LAILAKISRTRESAISECLEFQPVVATEIGEAFGVSGKVELVGFP